MISFIGCGGGSWLDGAGDMKHVLCLYWNSLWNSKLRILWQSNESSQPNNSTFHPLILEQYDIIGTAQNLDTTQLGRVPRCSTSVATVF
jgi:hypothetical protein